MLRRGLSLFLTKFNRNTKTVLNAFNVYDLFIHVLRKNSDVYSSFELKIIVLSYTARIKIHLTLDQLTCCLLQKVHVCSDERWVEQLILTQNNR